MDHVRKNIEVFVGGFESMYKDNPKATMAGVMKMRERYQKEYGVDIAPLFTNPTIRAALDQKEK